jgi:PAS domain S-box-containing protein
MNAADFTAGADRELLARKVEETLTVGEAMMEADLVSKDGSRAPYFFSGTRIILDGRPCVAGMGFDISKRKRAEAIVEDRERRLNLIYQNVADSLYVLEVEPGGRYRFVSVNEAFLAVTGFRDEQVTGRYVEEVLPPTSHELVREKYEEAVRENRTVRWEEVAEMPAGRRIGEVFVTPVRDDVTGRLYLLGGVHDLTDRIAGEEALRESQQLLQLVLATLPVGVVVMDQAGDIILMNAASKRIWGDHPIVSGRQRWAQVSGFWHNSGERIAPTDWASVRALSQGQTTLNELIDIKTYDGQQKTIENSAAPIRNAEEQIVGAVVVNEDVTERKQAEEQLQASREQLRALSARLLSAREEERKSVAREIHDELGQALTGLIIELSWLEDKLAALPDSGRERPLIEKVASMLRLTDSTVESVRRIASELRPGLLDDFGLVAAIEWHAQEFEQRTGVSCQVSSELDETVLSPEQATALFRIAQEALTNVARHAAATSVQVRLFREVGQVVLRVEDDGRGIGSENSSPSGSLGVVGMRERAALLGGSVQITGSPGGGTVVEARVPFGARPDEAESA